ncbi:MAG: ABC transporter permease, partial [Clostridia bacterium]|nr:ABC transporter permease [Clostridia bacterium]
KQKPKKRSMSLLTALSLSLNNLLTKKGRTFLTSFAGSIGIIGIALILALSNGINLYIRHIQEDALSSYPITVNREETDLVSMISSLGEQRDNGRNHPTDDGNIYSSPVFYNLINTLLAPDKSENDLAAFKAYIDGGAFDGVNATVQYGYDIPLTVYTRDPSTGEYISSDIYALMSSVSGASTEATENSNYSFSSSFSTYSVWSVVLGGKDGDLVADLVKEQYDLLAGEWPTGAGDVLLVLNDHDEVNDLTLYALGLKGENEMRQMMVAAFTGSKIEQPETEKWSYGEILGRTFRTVAPARLYQKIGGKWQNVSNQQAVLETMLTNDEMSIELRVCGILRKNPDATSTSANGTLLYTSALTKYLIASTASSEIVKEQLADPDTDVLTGLPFKVDPGTLPKTSAERAERLTEYVASLTPQGKAELLKTMLKTHYDPATNTVKHVNLRVLDAVNQAMATVGSTREEITAWVGAYYPEYSAYISYFDNDADLLATVKTLLALKVAQEIEARGEALYESYRNTPSDPEITAAAGAITATLTDRTEKQNYVVGLYLSTTELSEDALTTWAGGLSDDELDGVVGKLAREQAKAQIAADPTVDEATKDARCGAVLDTIIASFNETQKATAYQYFVPDGSAGTSYEETLAKLYVYEEDNPSSISIYVTTFEEKDKVTAIIADYNDSVEEDKQITYTDIMALLMTSITYILNAVTYVLVAFVSVSLVVSSIMIGIITYISVLERTKEIGILRAIGASKRDVSRVFNAETLIIGLAAGLIGIIVTLLFCIPINLILRALSGISNIAAVLPVGGGIALVLISMGLTLLAGLIPARMASKKDPVVALRTE